MKIVQICFFFTLIFIGFPVFSQKGKLQGFILDDKKNPINDNKVNYKKNTPSEESYNYNINDFNKDFNKKNGMKADTMGMYAGDNLYAMV